MFATAALLFATAAAATRAGPTRWNIRAARGRTLSGLGRHPLDDLIVGHIDTR
jgi:hypothetical protein